jgi:pantetheine-phosphate adenylyltransferase
LSVVRAVYPGTFDPVTVGHVDIVERTARLFDEVVVAVYIDPPKSLMFSVDERVEMVRAAIGHVPKIDVRPFGGLLVELAHRVHATVIVRGLRIGSDFEYEREMALMNRRLLPGVETACLLSSLEYQFVSSTRVKEIAALGGDVSEFIPAHVVEPLYQRLNLTPPSHI